MLFTLIHVVVAAVVCLAKSLSWPASHVSSHFLTIRIQTPKEQHSGHKYLYSSFPTPPPDSAMPRIFFNEIC